MRPWRLTFGELVVTPMLPAAASGNIHETQPWLVRHPPCFSFFVFFLPLPCLAFLRKLLQFNYLSGFQGWLIDGLEFCRAGAWAKVVWNTLCRSGQPILIWFSLILWISCLFTLNLFWQKKLGQTNFYWNLTKKIWRILALFYMPSQICQNAESF